MRETERRERSGKGRAKIAGERGRDTEGETELALKREIERGI